MGGGDLESNVGDRRSALVLKLSPMPFHHGVLAIIRGLGRAGVPVYAVMEDAASPAGWSRHITGRFLWTPDLCDTEAVLRELIGLARQIGGRPVLMPTDDAGAILVAEHGDELAPHFRLSPQPRDLPRRLAAKDSLAELCEQIGLPWPRASVVTSGRALRAVQDEISFPAVLKLARPWENDGHSRVPSTTIVEDARALRRFAAQLDQGPGAAILVQEYLAGSDCEDWFFHGCVGETADGAAAFRLSFTGVKVRSFPPRAGFTSLGVARDNPELRRIAESFLVATGYRGIVDMDFRLDHRSNSYYLLDANPRAGAQFAIARRSDGIDAAQALYRELTGRPLPPQVEQSQGHALCVENYDLLSSGWLLFHRRLTPAGWYRSVRGRRVEWAWFAPDDPAPCAVMWAEFLWYQFALRLLGRSHRKPRARHAQAVRRDRFRLGRRRYRHELEAIR